MSRIKANAPLIRNILSAVLILASIAWIVAVASNIDVSVADLGLAADWWMIASVAVLGLASALMKGIVFAFLLQRRDQAIPAVRSTGVYLVSQLVRYLPGRVWGFVYSAVRLSDAAPQRVVWASSIENLILSTLNSIGVGLGVVFVYLEMPVWGILALGSIWVFLTLELRHGLLSRAVSRLLPRWEVSPRRKDWRWKSVFALLQIDWVFYLALWGIALTGRYDLSEAAVLGVLYAVAWIVGLVAVLVPAGLVVREATFVWLATQVGFEPDAMLVIAGLARIVFLAIDFLAFGLGLLLARRRSVGTEVLDHAG